MSTPDQIPHTIDEQLENLRRLIKERSGSRRQDQSDIDLLLEADQKPGVDNAWSGQHARLINTKGWEPV